MASQLLALLKLQLKKSLQYRSANTEWLKAHLSAPTNKDPSMFSEYIRYANIQSVNDMGLVTTDVTVNVTARRIIRAFNRLRKSIMEFYWVDVVCVVKKRHI